jgi:hypothetical protein
MAPNKTVGPVQALTFLGLKLDTIKYEASRKNCKMSKTTGANFYKPFQCHSLPYKQVNHKVVW